METKTPPKTQRSTKLEPGFGAAGKPGFLGAADCYRLTGITRQTWTGWAAQGKITAVRLGKRWLIPVSEFERLLSEGTVVRGSVTPEASPKPYTGAAFDGTLPEGCSDSGGGDGSAPVSPAKQQESSIS